MLFILKINKLSLISDQFWKDHLNNSRNISEALWYKIITINSINCINLKEYEI